MKASVIVTTYNNPSALRKVLLSLASQKSLPHEVIVADDGSGPETSELIREAAGSYPVPLKHVRHEDMGFRVSAIRNRAIESSEGDYIVILDGDCVVPSDFVGDHIRLSEEGFFVQGKRLLVGKAICDSFGYAEANSRAYLMGQALRGNIGNAHHILRIPSFPAKRNRKLKGIKGCNMGFFRSDLFRVNGFNEDFVGWGREDSELAVRLFNAGLMRKEHPFMAVCFHLWHADVPRESLSGNQVLLEKTINGKLAQCENGLKRNNRR